ncbi:MFS transporter [Actinopolymorpha sp. B17G11]|uniref:MFS transporter n=1 Tax=Actinopolymorpha sp. B17G11 TaxID=3160861 RepID=UPI0032E504AE
MSYRSLFGVREFRYLYASLTLSYIGDQLSAVAVSVLVFDRTGSALLTALAYASAWLPGIVGGPLLGPLADRLPRRDVLVVCDMARALLVSVLAIPGISVSVAIALLYITHAFKSPFTAARSALLPEVLSGQTYITGNGLNNITHQVANVVGFGLGGIVVTLLRPNGTLLLDAATFAVSAVLVRIGVRQRPAAVTSAGRYHLLRESVEGLRYVFGDRWLRGCLLLVWFGLALPFGPEAVAYPYAQELNGGARAAGVMLAAPGLGYIVGAVLLTRVLTPRMRNRLLVPFATMSSAALVPALLSPPLPVVVLLLLIVGIGSAFSAPLNAIFAQLIAPEYRGRAMAVAISGILAMQGLAFLLTGALVDAGLPLATVVGLLGILGLLAVAASTLT